MSTTNVEDLYITIGDDNNDDNDNEEDNSNENNDSFTVDEHMMVHGVSLYRDVLQKETAKSLREYIVYKNAYLKPGGGGSGSINVIENAYRWSFGIGANDDRSVVQALEEIATHNVLKPALEKILGKHPALIEMTAITAGYGAVDQFWHPDVTSTGSPVKYARNFLPSYSLFITLQVRKYFEAQNVFLFCKFKSIVLLLFL